MRITTTSHITASLKRYIFVFSSREGVLSSLSTSFLKSGNATPSTTVIACSIVFVRGEIQHEAASTKGPKESESVFLSKLDQHCSNPAYEG